MALNPLNSSSLEQLALNGLNPTQSIQLVVLTRTSWYDTRKRRREAKSAPVSCAYTLTCLSRRNDVTSRKLAVPDWSDGHGHQMTGLGFTY